MPQKMRTVGNSPIRKVRNGGIAGVIAGIGLFAARQFGLNIPDEVGNAVIVLLGYVAAYFTRPKIDEAAVRVG